MIVRAPDASRRFVGLAVIDNLVLLVLLFVSLLSSYSSSFM